MSKMDLWHGDCLELMKNIPDKSIDLVLTDPPYGKTACKWDVVISFEPMWEQLKRITKERSAICLFGSEPFSSHLRLSNLKMFKYDWVWIKEQGTCFLNSKKYPLLKSENISVFCKKPHFYNPQMLKGKPYIALKGGLSENYDKDYKENIVTRNNGTRYPVNVLEIKRDKIKLSTTQKPVALLEYLIKTYTLEGETVLDFTAGSFSTGVACVNTGRSFIGIEKDDHYFSIGKKRVEDTLNAKLQK